MKPSPHKPLASQWLEGTVRHRRRTPVAHQFEYHTGMLALNLDEWSTVTSLSRWFSLERFNWLSLHRKDYFAPERHDLKRAISEQVEAATGWYPDGEIELITHPRYFGYVFNPVSFYFCYDAAAKSAKGAVPRVIAAQISNTPWHERHVYCLERGEPRKSSSGWNTQTFSFRKRFHVSPYNPMDQQYHWLFSFRNNELRIHMNVHKDSEKIFDATLSVQRVPLTRRTLHQSLRRFPLESFKVVAGIYWHALKLKIKGAKFETHPDKLDPDSPSYRLGASDRGEVVDQPTGDPTIKAKVSSWRT